MGCSLWWLLLLPSTGSRHLGSVVAGRRLRGCGARAELFHSAWSLPGSGTEPTSPALAGRLLSTVPPGKSPMLRSPSVEDYDNNPLLFFHFYLWTIKDVLSLPESSRFSAKSLWKTQNNFLANPVFVVKSEIKSWVWILVCLTHQPPLPPCSSPRTESCAVSLLCRLCVRTEVTPGPHLHTHSLPPSLPPSLQGFTCQDKTRICHPAPSEPRNTAKELLEGCFHSTGTTELPSGQSWAWAKQVDCSVGNTSWGGEYNTSSLLGSWGIMIPFPSRCFFLNVPVWSRQGLMGLKNAWISSTWRT